MLLGSEMRDLQNLNIDLLKTTDYSLINYYLVVVRHFDFILDMRCWAPWCQPLLWSGCIITCFLLFYFSVQNECIPQAVLGMDVLCQAKSGMGKTAVFVLATLQQLEPVDGQVIAWIQIKLSLLNQTERICKEKPGFE